MNARFGIVSALIVTAVLAGQCAADIPVSAS